MKITNSQIERIEKILSENSIDPKPDKKIIDPSVCIKSGIDMEFSDQHFTNKAPFIGKLVSVYPVNVYKYSTERASWKHCRVRQNHWMAHANAECPIPKGLIVEVKVLTWGGASEGQVVRDYKNIDWNLVYQYRVEGPEDNYRYEWEEE